MRSKHYLFHLFHLTDVARAGRVEDSSELSSTCTLEIVRHSICYVTPVIKVISEKTHAIQSYERF